MREVLLKRAWGIGLLALALPTPRESKRDVHSVAEVRMPDFLCFNTDRRDHAGLYGVAFYDLYLTGRQGTMASHLEPGDQCLVATPTKDPKKIEFGWFVFLHDKVMPDPLEPGTKVRVLFGKPKKTETLAKSNVRETMPYSKFFKRDGSFKRGIAVIKG